MHVRVEVIDDKGFVQDVRRIDIRDSVDYTAHMLLGIIEGAMSLAQLTKRD